MHTWASLKNSFYLDAWFFDIATREQNTHRNAFNKSIYGHVCSFVNLLKIIVTLYSSAIISHWGIIIYLDTLAFIWCMSFEKIRMYEFWNKILEIFKSCYNVVNIFMIFIFNFYTLCALMHLLTLIYFLVGHHSDAKMHIRPTIHLKKQLLKNPTILSSLASVIYKQEALHDKAGCKLSWNV